MSADELWWVGTVFVGGIVFGIACARRWLYRRQGRAAAAQYMRDAELRAQRPRPVIPLKSRTQASVSRQDKRAHP